MPATTNMNRRMIGTINYSQLANHNPELLRELECSKASSKDNAIKYYANKTAQIEVLQ